MAHNTPPSMGQMISTFSFILFGLLLALASLAEVDPLKSAMMGGCSILSLAGAARFKIQTAIQRLQTRRKP
jgi:hypothetical protein